MLAREFRHKGAGPLLGARRPGEQGSFGPYGSGDRADSATGRRFEPGEQEEGTAHAES